MKEQILALLAGQKDFISGEVLAQRLHITRAAVWKHISLLKQQGYDIQSVPAKGYRLVSSPATMYAYELQPYLKTKEIGRHYQYETQLTSTNTVLKTLAEQGAPHGMVLAAAMQTAGKGRLGRSWSSIPYCGIWYSVLLRPEFPPQMAGVITLTAAVSVVEALSAYGVPAKIKWPNDILLQGKKLCGILSEMRGDMDTIQWIILGIGVNVGVAAESMPEELQAIATSLAMSGYGHISQPVLAAEILNCLEKNYHILCCQGFSSLREIWMRHGAFLDELITVSTIRGVKEGICRGIDEEGYLLLEDADGSREKIAAGDVTKKETK